jgi:hypothetical protein
MATEEVLVASIGGKIKLKIQKGSEIFVHSK